MKSIDEIVLRGRALCSLLMNTAELNGFSREEFTAACFSCFIGDLEKQGLTIEEMKKDFSHSLDNALVMKKELNSEAAEFFGVE